MSFARNFALGQKIADDLINTYYASKERRDLDEATKEPIKDLGSAYTEADAEQLHALANATDQSGNRYYDVTPTANGGYGIRPRFQYQDKDGQMVQPDAPVAAITPRANVQEFFGQRYESGYLTPDRVRALRQRKYADIIALRDPIAAQRMLMDVDRAERELDQYEWEKGLRPFKEKEYEQKLKAGALGIAKGEEELKELQRAEDARKVVNEALQLPDDALLALAGQLKPGISPYPLVFEGVTEKGYSFLTTDPQTGSSGKSITLTPLQTRQLAAAYMLAQKGFGAEALSMLEKVDKNLFEHIKAYNEAVEASVKSKNNAASLTLYEWKAKQNGREPRATPYIFTDPNTGQAHVYDLSRVPIGPDGQYMLPQGLLPKGAKPQELTEFQKLLLPRLVEELIALPPNASISEIVSLAKKYGFSPDDLRKLGYNIPAGLPTPTWKASKENTNQPPKKEEPKKALNSRWPELPASRTPLDYYYLLGTNR